jgi:CzcA family heavy metal efflux pump
VKFLDLIERHRGAVLLLLVVLAAAGVLAALSLPSSIYPELTFPRILLIAHSGSLPARTMIESVARPLEQAVMEVPGIRRVRSRTFRGATELSALFDPSTDMAAALQQVQSQVAETRGDLPAGSEVVVERLTAASFPVLSLNVTGNLPIPDLRDYAFYVLRPTLSRVPGVGRVEIMASDTREIEVVTDPLRLLAAGLTVDDAAQALRQRNQLVPVGILQIAGRQQPMLASSRLASVADIAATPVTGKNGGQNGSVVRIGDVARVFPGAPDRTLLVTGDGKDAAIVNLSHQPGTNLLDLRTGVEDALRQAAKALPSGLRITKVYDLAEFVATAIANVRDAILIGGFLAVVVLIAFLRDWRMTLIASLTLPVTVLCTFPFLLLVGESVNLMSMGGLAVAIGLVIDDAVVVVENLHRKLGSGTGSVRDAMAEIVAPVVGSTLTTVVVLLPLGLFSGVAGQFFRSLSTTLSVAVLLSLVLALTLTPLLAEVLLKEPRDTRDGKDGGDNKHTVSDDAPHGRLWRGYERSLKVLLDRPKLALVIAILLLVAGGVLLRGSTTGFLPAMDEGGFVIDYLTPPGTALAETDRQIRRVEAILAKTPEVAAFSRRTGSELGLFATEPSRGDVLVRLKPRKQRNRTADEIIDDLRPRLQEAAPAMEIEFVQILQDMIGDLEGSPSPIEVKLFGDDPAALQQAADQVTAIVEKVPGVVDVVAPAGGGPEITWEIDPAAAARSGLTVDEIATQLSNAWQGQVATDLVRGDRTVPVRVRYPDADRFDPTHLGAVWMRNQDGKLVSLAGLARQVTRSGEGSIERENQRRMMPITGRLEGSQDLGSAIAIIQAQLAKTRLPLGVSAEIGGQYETQKRAFRELLIVFALSAILVLLVLVVQFRGFRPALLILASAPLSLGGAFLLLRLTGTELNVSSSMGLILLVGLVVKNGIVMLDYAHRLLAEGRPLRESIATAAGVRLRPILMTTLCTLLGLLPLALGLGAGAELQKPLAIAVIGGLGFSTIVTLYLIPSLYLWLERKDTV